MTGRNAILASVLLVTLFVFTTGFVPARSSDCDCPDPAKAGHWVTIVDKELSTSEAPPMAGPLGFGKSMTLCMTYDPTNKSYTPNANLYGEGSIDGRTWYPLTVAGTNSIVQATNRCLSVSPTRYVRVTWGATAVVPAPGPRVTASVQVGY